ncbi:LCP family protein required for cell wall assembly [Actinoplanes octamycinicus]|uniref:LCP family protein required for cell wall assembly n=1 Tax=Actinoplanes octamycinicus TaxID=135948 RepID=A0A7W7GU41_9ACTN|nr:LCP family protein [Actinoplanes octamycinicus]MBB4738232.1 LCP family protein required for cell wall assembly [Actinoplanes octamycinicus]GIE59207.1 hypothetical protein Aoc01nite_46090 [Actinoplanes octamycinicus]
MSKVEEELRAAFERHEALVPDPAPVRDRIDFAWVRVKRRRARQRVIGAAAAVLLAGVGLPIAVRGWGHGEPPAGEVTAAVGSAAPVTGPVDVLLIGSDLRLGEASARADTVMLLHVPADRGAAWMVSLPRDGIVDIPGHGTDKLNKTLTLGGPRLTAQTVTRLTGIEPDAAVVVDLTALSAVTEAVGGVTMCLHGTIPPAFGRKGFPAGCHHIGGDDVTPLLRARIGLPNGSYDRDENAQKFLRALTGKLTAGGAVDPAQLRRLLAAARDGVRIDGDLAGLLRVVEALGRPEVIGIREPSFASRASGEEIYPIVGKSLYQAIRDDRLEEWATANPRLVSRQPAGQR